MQPDFDFSRPFLASSANDGLTNSDWAVDGKNRFVAVCFYVDLIRLTPGLDQECVFLKCSRKSRERQ
jgi:hypothetical protein